MNHVTNRTLSGSMAFSVAMCSVSLRVLVSTCYLSFLSCQLFAPQPLQGPSWFHITNETSAYSGLILSLLSSRNVLTYYRHWRTFYFLKFGSLPKALIHTNVIGKVIAFFPRNLYFNKEFLK